LLSVALVPGLGAEGASIASAVCEFVVAGGYMLAITRGHAHLRPSLAALPRVVLVTLLAASVLALPLPSIVLWGIASVIYLGLLALLHAYPEELLQVLLRRVR
jgi:O-antigen/teichoic acid export membrane protein